MNVRVPQLLWYGNTETDLDFPPSWQVFFCPMKGANLPKLSESGMESAFRRPIGTPPIKELARGKKEVAIIFDDMSRSTPVYEIIPFVLRHLEKAGISDRQIRFIAALGAHGAHTANDFRKKLGEEVLDRFYVFNHNPFDFCTYLGKTSRGTPVSINQEVMACDLKIGIGSIVPHAFCGYGGGGKIILPGVAHMDTIIYNHAAIAKANPGCLGLGKVDGNLPRLDIEEAARMAGLDVKIDALVNQRGEVTGLFSGEPVLEHREGLKTAREVYATTPARDMDIVVANAHLKPNEAVVAPELGARSLKESGGDLVVIATEPAGQVVHYALGEFGPSGQRKTGVIPGMSSRVERLIVVLPFKDPFIESMRRKTPNVVWVKTWQECVQLLKDRWKNDARVAVYPDATIQYFPPDL